MSGNQSNRPDRTAGKQKMVQTGRTDTDQADMLQTIGTVRQLILGEITAALNKIDPAGIGCLIEQLNRADKIFLTGVGRVGIALESWCKRLAHLGYRICMVGSLTEPHFGPADLLIVGSGSGSSLIPVTLARKAKDLGGTVFHIGSNPAGDLSASCDYFLRIPVQSKISLAETDCQTETVLASQQLMTSLFEQTLFLLGDLIALSIAQQLGRDPDDYWTEHASLE